MRFICQPCGRDAVPVDTQRDIKRRCLNVKVACHGEERVFMFTDSITGRDAMADDDEIVAFAVRGVSDCHDSGDEDRS